MGDYNQTLFVSRHAEQFDGPFLEVGSRDYGSTQDLRTMFAAGGDYVGVDAVAGPGVDVVVDLTEQPEVIDAKLNSKRFGTIFCLSVLEHCRQPFRMAENLTRLLKPGGRICISVPFAWQFHAYPDDYWRFTHEGVKALFPKLEFPDEQIATATSLDGDFGTADAQMGKISLGTKSYRKEGRFFRVLSVLTLRMLSLFGILRWLSRHRHVLAPTNIMMVGTLPECDEYGGLQAKRN